MENPRYGEESSMLVPFEDDGHYLKIVQTTPYGGGVFSPVAANIQNYDTYIRIQPGDSEKLAYFSKGYFQAHPDGDYLLSYRMKTGNRIEERQDRFQFYPDQVPEEPVRVESNNEKILQESVSKYVMNSNNLGIRSKITSRMHLWPRLEREILVFRGQKDPMTQMIRTEPDTFFSTSLDWGIANLQFTSNDDCCLFVLHIQPGVRYYSLVGDIEAAIKNYNNARAGEENAEERLNEKGGFEEEVLIEGNGRFYQDKEKTVPGFREMSSEEMEAIGIDIGDRVRTHTRNGATVTQRTGVFEAYYFPPERMGGRSRKRVSKRKTKKHKRSKRHSTKKYR